MSLRANTDGARAVILLAAVLTLAACDGPGPLSKKAQEPAAAPPPAAAALAPPAPPPPAWAPDLLGKELAATYPKTMTCEGAVEGLGARYADAVTITGWAWNPAAKAPVARVVAVNRKGRFVGFGDGGLPHPRGAPTAPGETVYQTSGWSLVTGAPAKNGVRVFGLDADGKAACLVGEVATIPG